MNFSITSEKRDGYLFIETSGCIESIEELLAHSKELFKEIGKYDLSKILIYEPEIILPFDIVPYFNLVKDYVDTYPPEIFHLKVSLVVSEANKGIGATWETLCQSRGLQFFYFTSLEDGKACLINEDDE